MARETSKNLQKQITPHLIGRLTDADLWTSSGTLLPVKRTSICRGKVFDAGCTLAKLCQTKVGWTGRAEPCVSTVKMLRHQTTICEYLQLKPRHSREARKIAVQAVLEAAQVVVNPADLINGGRIATSGAVRTAELLHRRPNGEACPGSSS